jgi:putative hydroxymethylpyrimidine transport system permease protein
MSLTIDRTGSAAAPPLRRPRRILAQAIRAYGAAVVVLACIIGLWQLVVTVAHVPAYLIPPPSTVVATLADDWNLLGPAVWVTVREVLLGFAVAFVAGVLLAIALHTSAVVRRAVYPLLIGSQTVPIIVVGPILVILLGYNIYPKIIIVGLVCFFPIVVNTLDGLGSVTADYTEMMRTLDGSRFAIFRRVELPGCLPMMFTGIRIAVAYAAIGAVVAEWSGSSAGLGYVMLEAEPQLLTARIFAVIVLLTAISVVLFALVSVSQRLAIPWASGRSGRRPLSGR